MDLLEELIYFFLPPEADVGGKDRVGGGLVVTRMA